MAELNEMYGDAMELPTSVSGIALSNAPAPHEGANGVYTRGDNVAGLPAYYFNGYAIANLVGHIYALYDENWLYPDADNEIWNLGPDGVGPVTVGLLAEPFPSVEFVGVDTDSPPTAMLQTTSTTNTLETYSIQENPQPYAPLSIGLPTAAVFAPSPENILNDFPAAFDTTSYPPTYLGQWDEFPSFFWVRPDVGVTSIPVRIRGTIGTLINRLTGSTTAFGSDSTVSVPVVANKWQRFSLSANSPDNITSVRFPANGSRIGALIPILEGLKNNEFYIVGNYDILDIRIAGPLSYKRVDIPQRNVDGATIDKLLIALSQGAIENGTFVYSETPEAADSYRSDSALTAMATLLAKGWTLTR